MTPIQRGLILHALGLTPRNGRMRRWSRGNGREATKATWPEWMIMERYGLARHGRHPLRVPWEYPIYHVTRAGAEAAGVLERCRVEDVER